MRLIFLLRFIVEFMLFDSLYFYTFIALIRKEKTSYRVN